MENQLDNFFDIRISQQIRQELATLSTWARITALVAFISYGIGLIATFMASATTSALGKVGQVITYLVIAAIGVAINYYLYQFATKLKLAIESEDQYKLDDSFNHLRTYFKIVGILMIVGLGLVVLIILFAALGSLTTL